MLSKVFKAYDVRGVYPDPLSEQDGWKIGFAAGQFLRKAAAGMDLPRGDAVAVSRDMRPSSPAMARQLSDGLRAAGLNVIDLGLCDTSFQYFAVNHLGTAGGIQTTASHNPVQYNGYKFSAPKAVPIGADSGLKEIQGLAEAIGPSTQPGDVRVPGGRYEQQDLWPQYRQHVLRFLQLGNLKKPLRVFIDASNGMAGKMVPAVFSGAPNLEIIPLNFEITGAFVHEPNPLVAENMAPTQAGVKQHQADLGACFDGDADRCILTDETGQIIGCDHLTALLAEYFLEQAPGAAVVYDLRSSKSVPEAVTRKGGVPVRCRVGHVFMKQVLRQKKGIFGGELSGHFYFRDNYFADSGAIAMAAALSVLAKTGKKMSELIAPYKKYPQSGELNFKVDDKAKVLAALQQTFGPSGTIDELDGVTVDAWEKEGWWFNVRASNTEPLLRFNAEAKDPRKLESLLSKANPMLGTPVAGH